MGLVILGLAAPAAAQCRGDRPEAFGTRYGDTLAYATLGAAVGAVIGGVVGLVAPAIVCSSGAGEGACEAAWGIGVGGLGGLGWVIGTAAGIVAVSPEPDDTPLTAAGLAFLGGALVFAGGYGLYDATDEPGVLYASFGAWALTVLFVAPLLALVLDGEPTCSPSSAPLTWRFQI